MKEERKTVDGVEYVSERIHKGSMYHWWMPVRTKSNLAKLKRQKDKATNLGPPPE